METLEFLEVSHPYYCSDNNYYSREAGGEFETMTQFLDEFEDADIDMNLCFRWDLRNVSETEEGRKAGRYEAEVFIMGQRKGIFMPFFIKSVNEEEAKRFKKYAEKHWEKIKAIWTPFSV